MDLLGEVLRVYIDLLKKYQLNKLWRFGADAKLCDAKHASAEKFILQLQDLATKCQKMPAESEIVVETVNASPHSLPDIPEPLEIERPPSAASTKSSEKKHSLVYWALKKNTTVVPSPNPSIGSIMAWRNSNNTNNFIYSVNHDELEPNILEKLEDMFREEKLKVHGIRGNHLPGSYDALLNIIIENIIIMRAKLPQLGVCVGDNLSFELPASCDKHRMKLLFYIIKFIWIGRYDLELADNAAFHGKKEPYVLGSGFYSSTYAVCMAVESKLYGIIKRMLDFAHEPLDKYAKNMLDFLDFRSALDKLSGVSVEFIECIDKSIAELEEDIAKKFPDATLAQLFNEKIHIDLKPFSLDETTENGQESPYAKPMCTAGC